MTDTAAKRQVVSLSRLEISHPDHQFALVQQNNFQMRLPYAQSDRSEFGETALDLPYPITASMRHQFATNGLRA
jgi:hypothetical protein